MHLKDYEATTPLEYIQLRFRRGFDMEAFDFASPKSSPQMTERMVRLASRSGKHGMHVEALISRIDCESHFLYEVKWNNLGHAQNTFETIERLRELGVESMAHKLDEQMLYSWGGSAPRPLTTMEIVKHLEAFGFSEEMTCRRKISMLSSGQKCKLAFGAAFWTRPHVLCLDEPTNYLDVETTEILSRAIRGFRGACVVVSHSRDFVQQTCNEIWEVEHGKISNSGANASENTKMTRSGQKSRTKAKDCK
jgi:elongation factor 3